MVSLAVSDELNNRIEAFKPVIEAIVEESMSIEDCVTLILDRGLNSMLNDLLGAVDPAILLQSFHQLATQHPSEVYSFVASTLNTGAASIDRDKIKRQIGFRPPGPADTSR